MFKSKKNVRPAYLKEGDKVALISPAYWVPQEAIKEAADTIRGWGLQPVIGPHTNILNMEAYAGTVEERTADLLWALQDDSIRAIICSRGGYGSMHLLSHLPQTCFLEHPKWLIGHGDITILLHASVCNRVIGIHGPMAFQMAGEHGLATGITRDILFGTLPQYEVRHSPYDHCGRAEGILVGGNLSSYSAITGTSFQLPPKHDVILFIEETEEPLHNIDRLFYRLRLQLDFERVRGIILGSFNSIRFDLQSDSVEQMLTAHLAEYDIPVCCGFPVGGNSCIPMMVGAPCVFEVSPEKSVLTFNVEGERKTYSLEGASEQLFKK